MSSELVERNTDFLRYFFDLFEAPHYDLRFVSVARDKFVTWALGNSNLDDILWDLTDREISLWRSDYSRSDR